MILAESSIPWSGRSPGGVHATHSSIFAWSIPWSEEPGWLQYIGSHRVGHDLAHTCSHLKAWPRLEDTLPSWLTHMASRFVLAMGRVPQSLTMWAFSEDCSSVLMTWFLAFSRFGVKDLASEVTHAHFTSVLYGYTGQQGFCVWGDSVRGKHRR